jgi:hypothetical protein
MQCTVCVCASERESKRASVRGREKRSGCVSVRACVRASDRTATRRRSSHRPKKTKQTNRPNRPRRPPARLSPAAASRATPSAAAPRRASRRARRRAPAARRRSCAPAAPPSSAAAAAPPEPPEHRERRPMCGQAQHTHTSDAKRGYKGRFCARARACVCVRVCVCVWVSIYALPLGHEDGSPERRVGFSVLVAGNRGCLAVRDTLGVL